MCFLLVSEVASSWTRVCASVLFFFVARLSTSCFCCPPDRPSFPTFGSYAYGENVDAAGGATAAAPAASAVVLISAAVAAAAMKLN